MTSEEQASPTPKDCAKMVAKRFDVLLGLYTDKQLPVTELANTLRQDLGNMSRYVGELEKLGLISVKMQEGKAARQRKVCTLTERARKILDLCGVNEKQRKPVPDWQIAIFLDMLDDSKLTPEFHEFVAEKLADLALEDPASLIGNERINRLFEQISTNPPPENDKISQRLVSLHSRLIPQILVDEEKREWFLNTTYKSILPIMSDTKEKEKIRQWAIKCVSMVARLTSDTNFRNKTAEKLLKVYFEDTGELSNVAKEELANFAAEFREEILRKLKKQAEESEKKTKAEALLKELISLWSSNRMLEAINNAD